MAIRVGDKKTLIVRHKFEEFCDIQYDLTALQQMTSQSVCFGCFWLLKSN